MVCGVCGVKGHNRRTCGRVVFVPEVLVIMDEDPMEEDYVLTDDEDEYEVDIATPDWGNLPKDCVDIIIGKLNQYDIDYWCSKVSILWYMYGSGTMVNMFRGKETDTLKVLIVNEAPNVSLCVGEIKTIARQLESRSKRLTPKNMKYKYILKHTEFSKKTWGNGWYSWYHTLAQREKILNDQVNRRRGA
jgi:hypothetical protein